VSVRAETLLRLADDELVLGWRNSEWTGIAPFLEEDVAFSSIAQNEIGHARALYELAAQELGTDADALAFDRAPEEYRAAPLVQLRLTDWADTIARHYLYETADALRLRALAHELGPIAERIEREEAYHRMHAEMWVDRLLADEEGARRLRAAATKLWPYALGVVDGDERRALATEAGARLGLDAAGGAPVEERGATSDEWRALWEEMTMVRRLAPAGRW
jgi:ring-1,2-phenylacetyl-CoA epoxidase subunit PaaC